VSLQTPTRQDATPAGKLADMPLLRVSLKAGEYPVGFPFSLPAVRSFDSMELDAPVTFFVGENGSGKSTLLEAIAAAAEIPALGATDVIASDATLRGPRLLARALRLAWSPKSRAGFFMRAEDFFNYGEFRARAWARELREKRELATGVTGPLLTDDARHVDEVGAQGFRRLFDAASHGESFMQLFEDRLRPRGLYLLDEPEAPLSPRRQLELVALIARAAARGAQFVIATHSPVLLALPGAAIHSFDRTPVARVAYEDVPHVRILREVLASPTQVLELAKEYTGGVV
jgi:predicted ATPase